MGWVELFSMCDIFLFLVNELQTYVCNQVVSTSFIKLIKLKTKIMQPKLYSRKQCQNKV